MDNDSCSALINHSDGRMHGSRSTMERRFFVDIISFDIKNIGEKKIELIEVSGAGADMNTCIGLRLDYSKSTDSRHRERPVVECRKNRVSTRTTVVPFYTASYVNTVNMHTEICVDRSERLHGLHPHCYRFTDFM